MTAPALSAHPVLPLTPLPAVTPHLVALCGLAGSGKDEAAWNLIQQGYVRHNLGDVIKAVYDPFTRRLTDPIAFAWFLREHRAPDVTPEQMEAFIEQHVERYAASDHRIDAFTEDRALKPHIRGLLEQGGDMIYPLVSGRFFDQLDRFARPVKVVATRVCRVEEAQRWRERGAALIEVHRPDQPPASQWDQRTLTDLQASGLITHRIVNDSPTGSHWRAVAAPAALAAAFQETA